MENKSKLIRGTSKCARFFVCDTTEFVVVKTENGNKIEITPENMDILLGKLITTLQNPGNLDDNDQEPQTGVSEDGPNAGDTQKPNEPKIENNGK